MTASAFPLEVAYFQETAQGTGPANAAAWVSSGTRVRVNSVGEPPLTQMIDDPRSQERIFTVNDKVQGLENGEWTIQLPLAGAEVQTSAASQVAATAYSNILAHCLGNQSRTYRTTAKTAGSHSTSTIELDSNTGYDEGTFLAVEHSSGNVYIRRVTDLTGDVATFDHVLPFTPSDGDNIWPCIAVYVDQDVLCSSVAGPYTLSWLLQHGGASSGEIWEMNGCKGEITSINIERNSLASVDINNQVTSFKDPTETSEPNWTVAPSGSAGVPIGPSVECFLGTYGSAALNQVHVESIAVEPGVPAVPVDTTTEVDPVPGGMPGRWGYSTRPADTLITLNLVPWASSYTTDFSAGTKRVFSYQKVAPAASAFAIHASRCEIVEEPARGTAGPVSSSRIVLRCHEDTDNSAAGTANLWKSKLTIVLA